MSWRFNPFTGKLDRVTAIPPDTSNVVLMNVPCDPSVTVKDAVRMDGFDTAVKAQANSAANANFIGFVESKPSSTTCNIRTDGVTSAIFTGLDQTKEYFLSSVTAGAISPTPPTPTAGHVVLRVGSPFSATRFAINKGVRIKYS